MKISRLEQETIINFNAGERTATIYTRDKAVMRRLDALVGAFPEIYRCTGKTDIDREYELPKSDITFRKPRTITEAGRNAARERMRQYNRSRKE